MSTVAPIEVAGVVIEEIDIKAMSDEDIVRTNTFSNLMAAEARPEDPPTPVESTRIGLQNIPDFVVHRVFRGRAPDGSFVASGTVTWTNTDDNKHIAQINVGVLPEYRRRGIAKALLPLLVGAAEAADRSLVIASTSERVPAGAAFAERIGADAALNVHVNRLVLSDVDRDLVRRWIDEAPGRAPGYSLVTIDGRYPDDLIEDIVDVLHVMNDAPRDDLQVEDQKITVEQMREIEKGMLAQKLEHWSMFVRHDESGQLVGLTDVVWDPDQPDTVFQGNTGVRPEHRGHALGKWLKAVMLERILEERPGVVDIRTGNADSNDAMLGINKELGFRPYIAAANWQVTTEKVRAYLSSR
jgi:GNAT superfamily N-acetyltransferase